MPHAPAHPHEVAIEPPGIARAQHVGVLANPPLDRIDHGVRPVEAAHHQRVEPREPGELHQLRPRELEHEGGHAEAGELGHNQHANPGEPMAAVQQPDRRDLDRQQDGDRHQEHDQRRGRRQRLDGGRGSRLDGLQREERDEDGDDRREPCPQPRLEQEQEGEDHPEDADDSAHFADRLLDRERRIANSEWRIGLYWFTLRYSLLATRLPYIWIDRFSTAMAASLTASVSVGWAWQVRAMSSDEAPNSIATAASAIMLPASGPRMCTPSTRSVLASARIFTNPSVCMLTLARPLAVKGNFPVL